jgi:CubicO group peptidase (beta-lactamase class C family)
MKTVLPATQTWRDDSKKRSFVMKPIARYLMLCTTIVALLLTGCSPLSTSQPPARTPEPATPTPDPSRLVVKPEGITRLDAMLEEMARAGTFTGSVLIAQDGKVPLSKGYGLADRVQGIPNTPQTRFRLGSITKQFTAMAILILQSQGKLNVQDPICNTIAGCPAAWQEITIHHLLTHTSGLSSQLWAIMADAASDPATPADPAYFLGLGETLPLDFQPGERYAYSNPGYVYLAHIIEQVSGQSYAAFLEQAIFTPLKMHNTGCEDSASGVAVRYNDRFATTAALFVPLPISDGAGAMYSTAEDLFLWDQALYTDQLLPRAELDRMFEPYVPETDDGPGFGYGYGWGVWEDRGRPVVFATGGGPGLVTLIIRYPEDEMAAILLTNQGDINHGSIWAAISGALFGEE